LQQQIPRLFSPGWELKAGPEILPSAAKSSLKSMTVKLIGSRCNTHSKDIQTGPAGVSAIPEFTYGGYFVEEELFFGGFLPG